MSQDVYDSTWSGTHAEYELVKNDLPNGTKIFFTDDEGDFLPISSGAGFHNSIFRGKNLGSSVTNEQWDAIQDGSFDDLFIGDYWVINGVNWRIAHSDYWLGVGDYETTAHHVVIVPDTALDTGAMNDTDTTADGYYGSKMRSTNIATARTAIFSAFNESHVLRHRELLSNAMSNGQASNYTWDSCTVELLSEIMVCGSEIWGRNGYEAASQRAQLALFQHDIAKISTRSTWLLRTIQSTTAFAAVTYNGYIGFGAASASADIRPCFAIYQPT